MAKGLHISLRRIADIPGSKRILQTPYYFQCPPMEDISYDTGFVHNKYMTINRGEFSRRGGRSLITCSFNTLMVEFPYSFVGRPTLAGFDIDFLRARLQEISDNGYPFRFLASESGVNPGKPIALPVPSRPAAGVTFTDRGPHNGPEPFLRMDAVLESVRVTRKHGESDAYYFDLAFSEWRDTQVDVKKQRRRKGGKTENYVIRMNGRGKLAVGSPDDNVAERAGATVGLPPGFRSLKKRNPDLTLQNIARAAYGRPSLWKLIAKENDLKKWGADTPLIKHPRYKKNGGKIRIPPAPHNEAAEDKAAEAGTKAGLAIGRAA